MLPICFIYAMVNNDVRNQHQSLRMKRLGATSLYGMLVHRTFPNYLTIFTELEERYNCFSTVAQVITIRAITFSFILFASSSKRSRNRSAAILKNNHHARDDYTKI